MHNLLLLGNKRGGKTSHQNNYKATKTTVKLQNTEEIEAFSEQLIIFLILLNKMFLIFIYKKKYKKKITQKKLQKKIIDFEKAVNFGKAVLLVD